MIEVVSGEMSGKLEYKFTNFDKNQARILKMNCQRLLEEFAENDDFEIKSFKEKIIEIEKIGNQAREDCQEIV